MLSEGVCCSGVSSVLLQYMLLCEPVLPYGPYSIRAYSSNRCQVMLSQCLILHRYWISAEQCMKTWATMTPQLLGQCCWMTLWSTYGSSVAGEA